MQRDPLKSGEPEANDEIPVYGLKLKFKNFRIKETKADGSENILDYTLNELDGTGRDYYMNNIAERTVIGSDGKAAQIKNFVGIQSNLLARSVRDSEGKLVKEDVIQGWPSSMLDALYRECKKLSALDDKSEDRAKKD